MGATTDGYDGIPYDELPIEAVEVRPDQEQHLARRQRTGASHEVNIEPSWAVEAALDPRALVDDSRSRTGLSIGLSVWRQPARRQMATHAAPSWSYTWCLLRHRSTDAGWS